MADEADGDAELGRAAAAAAAAPAPRKSPGWAVPVIILVWLLNACLAAAAVFALINWSAFTWIVGSAGWATVFEIICIMCMVYLLCGGFCLLGWESRLRDSYLHLHNHTHCRLLTTLGLPFFIGCIFLTLSLLALVPFSGSNSYVMTNTATVFAKADVDSDGALSFIEFKNYTVSLSAYESEATNTEFLADLQTLYDSMLDSGASTLTVENLYDGTLAQLTPARTWFGASAAAIAFVSFMFASIYTCWYRRLLTDKLEAEPDPEVQFADREEFGDDDDDHKTAEDALLDGQGDMHRAAAAAPGAARARGASGAAAQDDDGSGEESDDEELNLDAKAGGAPGGAYGDD